jgi:hypothetical protein
MKGHSRGRALRRHCRTHAQSGPLTPEGRFTQRDPRGSGGRSMALCIGGALAVNASACGRLGSTTSRLPPSFLVSVSEPSCVQDGRVVDDGDRAARGRR